MEILTGQPTSPPSSVLSSPPSHVSEPSEPSSPLSMLSRSPSLPDVSGSSGLLSLDASHDYPSPQPSTPSGFASPLKPGQHNTSSSGSQSRTDRDDDDQPPPAKRRKIAPGPKERTTKYLDLTSHTFRDDYQLDRLLNVLRKNKKIVVVAGAGISTSAGLDDFRSKSGLFANLGKEHKIKGGSGKHLFDASVYRHDDDTKKFHQMVAKMAKQCEAAQPTAFHHMLASLANEKRLLRLYTQNIDCIETRLPPLATTVPLNLKAPWPTTIQVHGSIDKMLCTKCGHVAAIDSTLFDTHETPLCKLCVEQDLVRTQHAGKRSHGIGRLRPRIVLYNEYNPDEEAIGNVSNADLKARPDAVLVVGTSLQIPGMKRIVKEFCQVTRDRRDGLTVWLNTDPEPKAPDLRDCFDLVVKGRCDDVAQLLDLPLWNEPAAGSESVVTEEEGRMLEEKARLAKLEVQLSPSLTSAEDDEDEARIEVVIPARPTVDARAQGIPTPGASPRLLPEGKVPGAQKPKARTKQSRLAFGGAMAKSTGDDKASEPAKKARKRRSKPKKEEQPARTVMDSFKAIKTARSAAGAKMAKVGDDDHRVVEEKIKPTAPMPVETMRQNLQLPALRPRFQPLPVKELYFRESKSHTPLPKSSTDAADRYLRSNLAGEEAEGSKNEPRRDGSSVRRVGTPERMHRRRTSETVSPKSVPRGMDGLFD